MKKNNIDKYEKINEKEFKHSSKSRGKIINATLDKILSGALLMGLTTTVNAATQETLNIFQT